jgi:predicted sugar kinase
VESKKSSAVRVLHLDLTPMVRGGRSDLAFSLAVLGGLVDPAGRVFLTPKTVSVIIELTVPREVVRKVRYRTE